MNLIYSGGGNPRFLKIAVDHGYRYGAQLPDTIYGDLYFADQDWKKPNRELYMSCLAKYRPQIATVLDLERKEQLGEVLDWAQQAACFVEKIVFIPKYSGAVAELPRKIRGKETLLGYSVPTNYGKTTVDAYEFEGWDVHLLGGTPRSQRALYRKLSRYSNVVSLDINCFRMMATRFCKYFSSEGKWVQDGYKYGRDAPYFCFERSCVNIRKFWADELRFPPREPRRAGPPPA